jgi:glycosyltransferase involved in cell wall biosynthesis
MTAKLISLFVPNLEGGGAERVMVLLANRFQRAGFKVDLLLHRAHGSYIKDVCKEVSIVDLKASRLFASLWPLTRYIRNVRPDAMLSTPADANIVALLAWTLAGKPGRLVVREAITPSADDRFLTNFRSRIVAAVRRLAYRHATAIVAPSEGVANDLIEHVGVPRDLINVIPNPLDFSEIRAFAEAGVPEIVPKGAKFVLGVGRLTRQKDFRTLVRAFSKAQRDSDVCLVLLGEGEERELLSRQAAELGIRSRLLMPGFVDNPFAYMKRASLFVLSSLYEGLPNALLQALAVGTPVVATDCPSGPAEILDGGRWGKLVPVGDVDALAEAIEAGLRGAIERPQPEVLEARYSLDEVASEYLAVLLAGNCAPYPRLQSSQN